MSERRRFCAGALLTVVVVFTGCASPDASSSVTSVTSVAGTVPPTTAVTTTPTTPTVSSAPPATGPTGTIPSITGGSPVATSVVCRSIDIVVLGNSTDYWPDFVVGVDAPTDDAWPALAEQRLRREFPGTTVSVDNASVLGAGFDIGLYGVTSMAEQLDRLAAVNDPGGVVLVLAPSVVDLQLRSLDVEASFTAFERLLGTAESAFGHVVVLPMNPVASGFDPSVAEAVAAFNARLVAAGSIAADDESPLVSADGLFGDPIYYDDFDDGRLDTPGPDPDRLHPDADGHRRLADAFTDRVVAGAEAYCR